MQSVPEYFKNAIKNGQWDQIVGNNSFLLTTYINENTDKNYYENLITNGIRTLLRNHNPDVNSLKILIEHECKFDTVYQNIHECIGLVNLPVLLLMISYGLDINICGQDILRLAIYAEHKFTFLSSENSENVIQTIKYLLENGIVPDTNHLFKNQRSVPTNTEIFNLLYEHGLDINAPIQYERKTDYTILGHIIEHDKTFDPDDSNYEKLITWSFEHNVKIDDTHMELAIQYQKYDIIQKLVDRNISLVNDKYIDVCIKNAKTIDSIDILKLLLSSGNKLSELSMRYAALNVRYGFHILNFLIDADYVPDIYCMELILQGNYFVSDELLLPEINNYITILNIDQYYNIIMPYHQLVTLIRELKKYDLDPNYSLYSLQMQMSFYTKLFDGEEYVHRDKINMVAKWLLVRKLLQKGLVSVMNNEKLIKKIIQKNYVHIMELYTEYGIELPYLLTAIESVSIDTTIFLLNNGIVPKKEHWDYINESVRLINKYRSEIISIGINDSTINDLRTTFDKIAKLLQTN